MKFPTTMTGCDFEGVCNGLLKHCVALCRHIQ